MCSGYFAERLLKDVSLKYVFFLNSRLFFICLQLDRLKLFQMTVSDGFLNQCKTEAFLKFNSSFPTELARLENTNVSEKNCSNFTKMSSTLLNDTPNKTYKYTKF